MAKILVVDDSSIIRRNLSTILTEAGHNVVGEAVNGESAFREYERLMPDLVTMDITMPILNGIDAVKKILKNYPEANIIMISALDQKQMVLTAVSSGAKHYIIKPFTAGKVTTVINEVLLHAENNKKTSATVNNKLDSTIEELNTAIEDLDNVIDTLNDEAPVEESKPEEPALPFTIESEVNQLKIHFSNSIAPENFKSLNMIVQGFLFMKSLTVVLNLGDCTQFKEDVVTKLLELSHFIKGHSANIKIVANNNEVLEFLKKNNQFFASVIN